MPIPLKYNWRNLFVRRVSTTMTILGVALVVTVFLLVMSLAEGVRKTFQSTVSERDLVVLRVGAQSDVQSIITRDEYESIRTLAGIERDAEGNPLVSPELVVLINIARQDGKKTNVIVRGVEPVALKFRPALRLVEGRLFRDGTSECIVSRRSQQRFAGMDLGRDIRAGSERWTVVGVFESSNSPYDSEVWADLHDVQAQAERGTGFSGVRVRAVDVSARDRLIAAVKGDQRIKLEAKTEKQFFYDQMGTAKPIQFLAYFVAVIMAIGASFGAMNTMYAQVSARVREVATMRALGFSRRVILVSFVVESVFLALLGGVVGSAIAVGVVRTALTAPTGTQNFSTFAEILFNFRITPPLVLSGMVFALAMGLLGGFFPAVRAARLKITQALRGA
jgi:ABC-type lipoprotein release transport system permease subunit